MPSLVLLAATDFVAGTISLGFLGFYAAGIWMAANAYADWQYAREQRERKP